MQVVVQFFVAIKNKEKVFLSKFVLELFFVSYLIRE